MTDGSRGEKQADRVIKRTLPNGLKVLLKHDTSAPIVAVNVWLGVGSANETSEANGLAHFQEHMIFKGTEKYGVGEIANLVKSYGGNLNAGTSYSYTMYYIVLPSRAFSHALEIQADAMMHSTFDPEEFDKERLVVIDEARMFDDRPESFTFYRTMELGFEKHNYRRPIAGYQPVVEKISRDQLLDFYSNYYRPSNAVLIVVGDVEPQEALDRIEETYGAWEPGETVIGESPVEPPQTGMRFKAFTGTIDHGYCGAGFHVPNALHEDYPALEMLAELLSAGRSSRLHRKIVEEKRLATYAGASLLAEKWPGFFLFSASMVPQKWDAVRDAMFDEVERFKHERVGEDELEKARRQIEKGMYSELETMEGQASSLGYYELIGDYRLADVHREAIKKVNPDALMEVTRKYFHPDNCSLVCYLPETDGRTPDVDGVKAAVGRSLSGDGGVNDMSIGTIVPVEPKPDDTEIGSAATETVETGAELFTLDNGLRVFLKRRTTVPMVSILTVFQGGARLEPTGKSGLATLVHRVIPRGTRSYNAEEIVRRIEGAGGSIESYADFDTSGVYVNVLSDPAGLGEVLPVYREVVREPSFNANRVEQERTRLLEELSMRRDNPVKFAIDSLFEKTFGDHPYSYPYGGSLTDVERLSRADCMAWYEKILVPGNIVVVLVGDVTRDQARDIAGRLYGDLAKQETPAPAVRAPEHPVFPGEFTLSRKNLKQAVALLGFTAPPMMDEQTIALEVLNGVLTGLGGRLFVELRDKRSLGYMTGSSLSPLRERSIFFGYANPGADGVEEALRVISHELKKVTEEEVTDEELTRSREWLIGSRVMQLQRNFAQAISYGEYEALGFGWEVVDRMPELIQRVTKRDIVKAAANTFDHERAVQVMLLPED